MKNFPAVIAFVYLLLVSSVAFSRDLSLGVSGDDVKAWQTFLVTRNFDLPVNGKFGPATERATKVFQKKWKLYADGIVGKQTMQKAKSLGFSPTHSNTISRSLRPTSQSNKSDYTVESQANWYKDTDSGTLRKIVTNYTKEIVEIREARDNEIRQRGPKYDPSSYNNMIKGLQIAVDAAAKVLNSRR
jgi:peptidoglycan hydrolase-like protein with peptidoglycan-binding domain